MLHASAFRPAVRSVSLVAGIVILCGMTASAKAKREWFWPLNDVAGPVVAEWGKGVTGASVGAPVFGEAGINAVELTKSVKFDGVDDGISVNGLPPLNAFTISFWMKPEAAQGVPVARSWFNKPWTLQLTAGSDSTRATLTCWINDFSTQKQFFSQTIFLNKWTHIAMTLNKSADTIALFVNGFQTQVRTGLGNYSDDGSQPLTFAKRGDDETFYKGRLAGVSLYSRVLTPDEIGAIFYTEGSSGAKSQCHRPEHLSFMLPGHTEIQWEHNDQTVAHEVYVGTDSAAVRTATTSSPEFKGRVTRRAWEGTFADNTTYFWRIDEVYADNVVAGDIRMFTKCDPAATFESWGAAALDRFNSTFRKANALYSNSVKGSVQDDYAFVWGQTVAWFGLNAAAAYADPALTTEIQETFWPAFKARYRNFSNNLWAYNAYSGAAGTDRYIDDNGHIIVALMELYDLTHDQSLVDEAKVLLTFEMAYENTANGLKGMPWHEPASAGERNTVCNGVASTLICQAALMVYRVTLEQTYLDFAKRIYDGLPAIGMVKHTETGEGIVFEGCNYDAGTGSLNFNYGYLAYVTDYFLEADILLYEATGDRTYLETARRRALSLSIQKMNSTTGGMVDPGQWGGYTHVRALTSLYWVDPDPKWRNAIFSMLNRLHAVHDGSNRYSTSWNAVPGQLDTLDILGPASAITGFMLGAASDLWLDDGTVADVGDDQATGNSQMSIGRMKSGAAIKSAGSTLLLTVPVAGAAVVRIYALNGKTVAVLPLQIAVAGMQRVAVPATLAAGKYAAELEVGSVRCRSALTVP